MRTEQLKYYRSVLHYIINKIDEDETFLGIEWRTTEDFGPMYDSHKYSNKVKDFLTEGRMQLGNTLKFINDNENPYKESTTERLTGESEKIDDPVDTNVNFEIPQFDTKIKRIDYIREVLSEMVNNLYDIYDGKNIHLEDAISDISF